MLKLLCYVGIISLLNILSAQSYNIVETSQTLFYNDENEITEPNYNEPYFGQDAHYTGNTPSYTNNGNGTISDNVTGLMWRYTCDTDVNGIIDYSDKMSFEEALIYADTLTFAGYTDWRLPSIKEQYSLMLFSGIDPSGYNGSTDGLTPFIDTSYFEFAYGDESAGERIIDSQMATSTLYVGLTMNGDETMFGVNFADGRIKGYPTGPMPGQTEDKQFYVYVVRGNVLYGMNDFLDNGDNTITDYSTDLMWMKNDSEDSLNWEDALAWVQQKNAENFLGYNDWRLPNAKELHSIVDYSRSPQTTNSPAIDSLFNCSEIMDEGSGGNYPFYWTGTTHVNMQNGSYAVYICFGEALGWMELPPNSGSYQLLDVHGAGAQRNDPKSGNPDDWPYGNGPQGDVIRIYNHVRMVRDMEPVIGIKDEVEPFKAPEDVSIESVYPNPFNTAIIVKYSVYQKTHVRISVSNILGQEIETLFLGERLAGHYRETWNAKNHSTGAYVITIYAQGKKQTRKVLYLE